MSQEIRALRRWLWWRTREPKSITETQEGTRKYTFLFKLVTSFPLSPFSLQFTSQLKNHHLSQQIYNLVPVSALNSLPPYTPVSFFFCLQFVSTTSCGTHQRLGSLGGFGPKWGIEWVLSLRVLMAEPRCPLLTFYTQCNNADSHIFLATLFQWKHFSAKGGKGLSWNGSLWRSVLF